MKRLFTSESVTEGHPDKLCDYISDNILDSYLAKDKNARVACETVAGKGEIFITGEITSTANVDIEQVVRDTIKEVGYADSEYDIDYRTCKIYINLSKQSPDIALGVDKSLEDKEGKDIESEGAGDQGVISAQHLPDVDMNVLKKDIIEKVIKPIVPANLLDENTKYFINPTGRFVIGGPLGDSGLTGRKIIVDTYGGAARHGGGAFSGKDPTKVDRSASYMARHIAKNIVANGYAKKCEIQIAYSIGVAKPVSIYVNTYGTNTIPEEEIVEKIDKTFDLTPRGIINYLDLQRPIYRQTTNYGHFGKKDLPWEKIINF